MKRTTIKRGKQIADVLGWTGRKHRVKESIHGLSQPPPSGMLRTDYDTVVKNDASTEIDSLINGIEIGDSVAFAHTPEEELGELTGITGVYNAIVRTPEGFMREIAGDALVLYQHAGDELLPQDSV